jgi:predicted RNA methylase
MKKIIKNLIPESIREIIICYIEKRSNEKYLLKLKNDILSYYQNRINNNDINEVIDYLKSNPIEVFPYQFAKKYTKESIEVFLDETNGLKYVFHDKKRLYFKKSMKESAIKGLYRGLQIDQDSNSPHLYLTNNFSLNANDIIADIGCAEGNFTLSNIENIKKAYLFESDIEWIDALKATFQPWKEKIEIINKYVTDVDSDKTLNINTFYHNTKDITFFKVDIEGEEQNFLNACEPIFKGNLSFKMAICTYHKQNDEKDFTEQLTDYGFKVESSKGYMIFIYDKLINEPYLRKGLLRVSK